MGRESARACSPAEEMSFEQFLFLLSPFGTVGTAALLLAFLVGSYAVVAWLALAHAPALFLLHGASHQFGVAPHAWSPLVLALLTVTTLGMQRYVRIREQADEHGFAQIAPVAASAATLLRPASPARMLWASALGAAAGIAVAVASVPSSIVRHYPALFGWDAAVIVFLGVLFARGVVMSFQSSRATAHLIEHDLRIDLLHVERLAVIGRRGARGALVWFTCAAVVCLFFVGDGIDAVTLAILSACAVMGLWIFFRPMERVHRRIRTEKSRELDRIRNGIRELQTETVFDASAAARLQGLLAYEARIEAVHEWPFDQSTLIRVAAYVLIPAIPWFGEAFVNDLIQRMTK